MAVSQEGAFAYSFPTAQANEGLCHRQRRSNGRLTTEFGARRRCAAAGYWLRSGQGDAIRTAWLTSGIDSVTAKRSQRPSVVRIPTVGLLGIAAGIATCAREKPKLVAWINAYFTDAQSTLGRSLGSRYSSSRRRSCWELRRLRNWC